MLLLKLAFALVLSAASAQAQVITVKSGQHPSFTRLVLLLPEPRAWDFGRTPDGYAFVPRGSRPRYDLSTVFDLIPRNRLAQLQADPQTGALHARLGCACHAVASNFRPGIVMIDVFDGPAPADSPFEAVLALASPAGAQTADARPRPRPRDFLPLPQPAGRMAPSGERPPITLAPTGLTPLLPAIPSPQIVDMRQRLVRELAQGIAAGVIDPAPIGRARPIDPSPADTAPRPIAPVAPRPTAPQIVVRNGAPGAVHPPSVAVATCPGPGQLDLAESAGAAPPAVQIAQARDALIGEFDRIDETRVLGLARTYLAFGFGLEASSLLRDLAPDAALAGPLSDIGAILDDLPIAGHFRGLQPCDDAAALWAVLGHDGAAPLPDMNRPALLATFSALPAGLRKHLGPRLVDRLLAWGEQAAAQSVRDATGRAAGQDDPTTTLLDAELARARGATEPSEALIAQAVRQDDRLAPTALPRLIESRIARGDPPTPEMIVTLEALMIEHRAEEAGIALRHTLARALASTGQAERAFEHVLPTEQTLADDVWRLTARHAPDATLAAMALGIDPGQMRRLPDALRLLVAERLLQAGLPSATDPWLKGPESPRANMLRAQAALDQGDAGLALALLDTQPGPEAAALRAAAFSRNGDHAAAEAEWRIAGDPDRAETARLLRRDVALLAAPGDKPLTDLLPAAPPPDSPPLETARALVEQAATARQAASEFLAMHPRP